ncbi:Positive regulator of CheA protein activity (CheW) (plasmid) [Rhodovastum atsumiense]|uniref:chemotaxis protein CheW n=1 Tax=Rhodovastum atsumiense TaxID=504468 RepID=UPI0020245913|nr:chemotaxis protein CheW [Rhodovastum atsumiense]CAH2605458.1 Positive regulator of CheA protein activity (CheW) [Rhodovastum atsumiense]
MSRTSHELVTMEVAGQPFGIPVEQVRDVLGPQSITRIPLAPAAVAGSLNLRGRIVTVLDMRVALGLGRTTDPAKAMNVVTEQGEEPYSLLVDQVGDVLPLEGAAIEPPPPTLEPAWRAVSDGVVKLQDRLVLILLLDRLLPGITDTPAAGRG